MFDRAVMYKFILDPAGPLAVIGTHTQGLCGHNGQKGQTGAAMSAGLGATTLEEP